MMRTCTALVIAILAAAGCSKSDDKKAAPHAEVAATGPIDPDGTRHIAIEANKEGYHPDRIAAAPNEKLTLVFTRTADADCIAQVKVPGGKLVDLPMNQPVPVAVTVPASGEVGFACGMDMFHGVIVATSQRGS
jgi:plastocyanin domain-containing protein